MTVSYTHGLRATDTNGYLGVWLRRTCWSEDAQLLGVDAGRGAPRTPPPLRGTDGRRRFGRRCRWIHRVQSDRGSAGQCVADELAAGLLLLACGAVAVEPLAAPRRRARGGGGEGAVGESVEQDVDFLGQGLRELVEEVLGHVFDVC